MYVLTSVLKFIFYNFDYSFNLLNIFGTDVTDLFLKWIKCITIGRIISCWLHYLQRVTIIYLNKHYTVVKTVANVSNNYWVNILYSFK